MSEMLGQDPLLASLVVHQRRLHADVHPGHGGRLAPPLRRRRLLRASPSGVLHWNVVISFRRLGPGALPDPLHHQLLLEHLARREGGRQPLGRHDARVGGALAAAARQFITEPAAYRGPYEYSVPGHARGLHAAVPSARQGLRRRHGDSLHRRGRGRDTGLTNGKIGIWLFLASEVMLFGALFSTYMLLRIGARRGRAATRSSTCRSPRSTPWC